MTCRHALGDASCSTQFPALHRSPSAASTPPTPDAERYEIVDVYEFGTALVLKVKYPDCARCAYEGAKVLVYLDARPIDAMRWRRIDPHFRDPAEHRASTSAPPPDARFPASESGWEHAKKFARIAQDVNVNR